MLGLFAALLFGTAHAGELKIEVPADTEHLTLTCGSEVFERDRAEGTPSGGKLAFTFPIYPGRECKLSLSRPAGTLEQLGTWNCAGSACARTDSGTGPVSVGPGEAKFLMAADFAHTELELTCDSGFRARVPITEHEATFSGVPDGDECTLNLKGGAPYKFRPVGPGAWQCHLVSGTLLCKPR